MKPNTEMNAWLEDEAGTVLGLTGGITIGRGEPNQLRIADERVSRRHALIQAQGEGEFWLVDLGSRNGTYCNGRRVRQPLRLADGDSLQVGDEHFVFHHPASRAWQADENLSDAQPTLVNVRAATCWLLVADVVGSSQLLRNMTPEDGAVLMGQWLMHCTRLIHAADGTVNKYLGDGYFAFWPAHPAATAAMTRCLSALRRLQVTGDLTYRIALHHGKVWLGGGPDLGEESLSGADVNFVFRMEKLAGALGVACFASQAALGALDPAPESRLLGSYPLSGFPGEFPFYELLAESE